MDRERLRKILALADSGSGPEVLAALEAARRLLGREGLRLSDLAGPAAPHLPRRDGAGPRHDGADEREGLRAALARRERELAEARRALAAEHEAQAEAWRRRESDWAARLAEAGAEKARALAALGALTGRIAAGQSKVAGPSGAAATGTAMPPRSASARRAAGLALLRDPATRDLANREIARRLGVSPQSVANWRRLLAREAGAERKMEARPARLLSLPLGRRREG